MPRVARLSAMLVALSLLGCSECSDPSGPDTGVRPRPDGPVALRLATHVPSTPVPAEFFSLYINKVWNPDRGRTYWPPVNFGLMRLHDTVTRWHHNHVGPGTWAEEEGGTGIARITAVFHWIDQYAPTGDIPTLLTIGAGG